LAIGTDAHAVRLRLARDRREAADQSAVRAVVDGDPARLVQPDVATVGAIEERVPGAGSLYLKAGAEADVRQGQGGDGLVAQPRRGPDGGRLRQRVEAVEPLARLAAEAAGAGLVPQRPEELLPGVLQGLLLLARLPDGLGVGVGGADQAPRRADD